MIIPAVLLTKKTYGRNNGKLLYKCIPDDIEIKPINVPYNIGHIGFSKVNIDRYVLIDCEKKVIVKTIGPANILENYYEYQLYCKSLPLKSEVIEINSVNLLSGEDRTKWPVFSIDGEDTKDYDDAFSIKEVNGKVIVSIYIADVVNTLSNLNIWEKCETRISTIYLPNKIITMLPKNIVELTSLTKNKLSTCLAMDIIYNKNNNTDPVIEFSRVIIKPYKNHIYDSVDLATDINYKWLFNFTKDYANLAGSHELVEHYMRKMCFEAGRVLQKNDTGIFRTMNEPLEDLYPSNSYVLSTDHIPYVHITSPIRRIIDILNQIKLQEVLNIYKSEAASKFYNEWSEKLEYINKVNKKIKKVQNDCALLHLYPSIKDREFEGKILDNETKYENGIYKYTIFLKEINLISKINSLEEISGIRLYRLYSFEYKDTLKKKIKLQLKGK